MNLQGLLVGAGVALMAATTYGQARGQVSGGRLLVVEKGAMSLGIVDPASGNVLASVPEGGVTGHEVAASRDGKLAFLPIYGNSGVGKPGTDGHEMVVIDLASQKVVSRVDFGHGVRPHLPVLGPPVAGFPEGLLYVTTELDKSVTVVDPTTFKILGAIATGEPESHMLAVSHDGRRGYTANVGPGTVSVLDLSRLDLTLRKPGSAEMGPIAVIPVSGQVQRISISVDDRWVFTSDQTKPQLVVIDTKTNRVSKRVAMPSTGYGSAPTPDGRWLLVAMMNVSKVAVVDLKTMEVARTIDVAASPQAVLVRPDGERAYVSCNESGSVAEIDLLSEVGKWKVTRTIPVGKLADGMAWAR